VCRESRTTRLEGESDLDRYVYHHARRVRPVKGRRTKATSTELAQASKKYEAADYKAALTAFQAVIKGYSDVSQSVRSYVSTCQRVCALARESKEDEGRALGRTVLSMAEWLWLPIICLIVPAMAVIGNDFPRGLLD
jgi:hypothetical protein